jgi:Fe-S cluster assembly protein SufD
METAIKVSKKDQFVASISGGTFLNLPGQEQAFTALEGIEFPHRKAEAWKYSRVTHIANAQYSVGSSDQAIDLTPYLIEGLNADLLVFVNGYYRADLSSSEAQKGLTVCDLTEAAEKHATELNAHVASQVVVENEVFTAMNGAYTTGGAFVLVDDNAVIERPIHLLHLIDGENRLAQLRHVIVAGKSSQVNVVTSFQSLNDVHTLNNNVTEVVVGQNARVNIDKLQYEATSASHIATEHVIQGRDSHFIINTITLNGGWIRNNLNIAVNGENCQTDLYGVYLLDGKQHVDNHTIVDHKLSNCESNELYKGIMNDRSTGVFNGKVFVRPHAQKTNAYQSNANILLSDDATINSKPELEIYADDVKCSHGSTTGQFDEEAVFYLRSRGLSEDSARKLLVSAFAGDVFDNISSDAVRNKIEGWLNERFGWDFT